MKKIIEYVHSLLEGKEKKKIIENAVIAIIIGIIAIIAGGSFFGGGKAPKTGAPAQRSDSLEASAKAITVEEKADVQNQIEKILSKIDGAGNVSVMVTYAGGKELVPAYDTKKSDNGTEERDNGGGTRNIRQSDYESRLVFEEVQGGIKKPVVLKEMLPEVKGVVVVADGAGDPEVREKLSRAVQVLLDVPIHRIQVFQSKK
ncbi:MAG: stage III sporulation protein AG [Clostridia bacterium]|nr:stage III sporulation protein AG [Clostridia bacterium]